MNKTVTTQAELLDAAKEIVFKEGAASLNIRTLSQKCGISIGTVYNYFPSKADLMLRVVDNFWKSVFSTSIVPISIGVNFLDFFQAVYLQLSQSVLEFETVYLEQLDILCSSDKKRGKQIEQEHFDKVRAAFLKSLAQDPGIDANIWSASFTPEQFVSFLFDNILTSLKRGNRDCSYLVELSRRLLYQS